jgi:hypothetical protein
MRRRRTRRRASCCRGRGRRGRLRGRLRCRRDGRGWRPFFVPAGRGDRGRASCGRDGWTFRGRARRRRGGAVGRIGRGGQLYSISYNDKSGEHRTDPWMPAGTGLVFAAALLTTHSIAASSVAQVFSDQKIRADRATFPNGLVRLTSRRPHTELRFRDPSELLTSTSSTVLPHTFSPTQPNPPPIRKDGSLQPPRQLQPHVAGH